MALPGPTIDFTVAGGGDIRFENREGGKILRVHGLVADGALASVQVAPIGTTVTYPGFDITPARSGGASTSPLAASKSPTA